jgi:hypothetical protein
MAPQIADKRYLHSEQNGLCIQQVIEVPGIFVHVFANKVPALLARKSRVPLLAYKVRCVALCRRCRCEQNQGDRPRHSTRMLRKSSRLPKVTLRCEKCRYANRRTWGRRNINCATSPTKRKKCSMLNWSFFRGTHELHAGLSFAAIPRPFAEVQHGLRRWPKRRGIGRPFASQRASRGSNT